MKKELGKGATIGVAVLAAVVLGAVVYFSFFRSAGYTAEDQARNDAQTKISDQNFKRVTDSLEQGQNATPGQNPEQAARDGR